MTNTKTRLNVESWEFTQKIIRIGHNRRVKQYFKDVPGEESVNSGRAVIKTSLLIREGDSGIETLNKMTYFASYLAVNNISSQPDGWQLKKGQNIPQVAIIYRPVDKNNKSGNYTIHIPHFTGVKTIRPFVYTKGSCWARWILKDNSQIIVNGSTPAESLRVIRQLEKYVDSEFRTKEALSLTTGVLQGEPFKKVKVAPLRADYYSKGKTNNYADWRIYL